MTEAACGPPASIKLQIRRRLPGSAKCSRIGTQSLAGAREARVRIILQNRPLNVASTVTKQQQQQQQQ